MITQISIFDNEKKIRITYDKPYFEITDEHMNHVIFSEEQIENLGEMIEEFLQMINKRDWN